MSMDSTTATKIALPVATSRKTAEGVKLLCLKEVKEKTGLARATIYRHIKVMKKTGDTSLFPIPVQVSKGRIGWLENEVNDWIKSRPRLFQVKKSEGTAD